MTKEKCFKLLRSFFLTFAKSLIKVGGIRAWVIKVALEHFYDEIGEPIIRAVLVKAGYLYHKHEGKILIKKLEGAQDVTNYNDIVDDILS